MDRVVSTVALRIIPHIGYTIRLHTINTIFTFAEYPFCVFFKDT